MRTDHGDHCDECHPELHRAQCSTGGCVAAREFRSCGEAPVGIVTNCTAMKCETNGCAMKAPQEAVLLDDLRLDAYYAPPMTAEITEGVASRPMELREFLDYLDRLDREDQDQVWRKWGVNDTGTRVHLYTNRCLGCCENQGFHDRRFTPQSLCRQSWTPWPGNPVDDATVPRCKTCQRLHEAWAADELYRVTEEMGLYE